MEPVIGPALKRTLALGGAAVIGIMILFGGLEHLFGSGAIHELPPLSPQTTSEERVIVNDPRRLDRLFDKAGFELASVRTGAAVVPLMLVRDLPDGFGDISDSDARKKLFIRTVLPLVLRVNLRIAAQRKVLLALLDKRRAGTSLTRREQRWLEQIARLYRTTPDSDATLRRRVAPIPPSLAIAQAAAETGWGSSRFAQKGNALFGQWTFSDKDDGMKPAKAASDARHEVKAYDRLVESTWDYARNLNTHKAYRALRNARARGERSGIALAGHLDRYSERGMAYVELLRRIIRQNDLAALDAAKIASSPPR